MKLMTILIIDRELNVCQWLAFIKCEILEWKHSKYSVQIFSLQSTLFVRFLKVKILDRLLHWCLRPARLPIPPSGHSVLNKLKPPVYY